MNSKIMAVGICLSVNCAKLCTSVSLHNAHRHGAETYLHMGVSSHKAMSWSRGTCDPLPYLRRRRLISTGCSSTRPQGCPYKRCRSFTPSGYTMHVRPAYRGCEQASYKLPRRHLVEGATPVKGTTMQLNISNQARLQRGLTGTHSIRAYSW